MKGIAFLVPEDPSPEFWNLYTASFADGNIANEGAAGLNPDYVIYNCNVYDKNMALLHTQTLTRANIDTARYIPLGSETGDGGYYLSYYIWPICDVFFDTNLVLTDTFYISITMNYEVDSTIQLYPTIYEIAEVHLFGGTTRLVPWVTRYYRDTLLTSAWHEEEYGWHISGIFPIIESDGDTCPQVRNVGVYIGGSDQFFLKWERGTNHIDWQVSYGPAGSAPGVGTLLEYNQPMTQLITVDPDSQYVAYVRARCRFARDEWGPWSDPVNIWLNNSNGIESAQSSIDFTLTPNPASGTVAIGCEAKDGTIEVVDMQGRVVLAAPSVQRTLDINCLAAGSYVVRLITREGTAVRRLQVE